MERCLYVVGPTVRKWIREKAVKIPRCVGCQDPYCFRMDLFRPTPEQWAELKVAQETDQAPYLPCELGNHWDSS